MSYRRINRSILLTMALLLIAALSAGLLLGPGQGGALGQKNESPGMVSLITSQAASAPVYYTDQVAILTYHNFGFPETGSTISPEHFREHIQGLEKLGYHFISLQQLSDFLEGKQQVPPNAIAITFDDGYASVYRFAFPVLQAENIPAAVFVIVKHVGAVQNQIPKLTWSQMQVMQIWGIDFHSHTYNSHLEISKKDGHSGPALISRGYLPAARREENAREYQDRIMQDLLLAKILLENGLGAEANFLALPYGLQNSAVLQSAQLVGYKYVCNAEPGLVKANSDHLALNRLNAGQCGLRIEDLHQLILKYAHPTSALKAL